MPIIRKILLSCGIISSLLYVATDIIASARWQEYSFANQSVSELIAIDAPTRQFMIPLFLAYSLLIIAFGAGIWVSARQRKAMQFAGAFIAAKEAEGIIGLLWSPMHLRGAGATVTDTTHTVLALIGVIFMLLGIWFSSRSLGRAFRIYSEITMTLLVVGGGLAGLFFNKVSANLPTPGLGIAERINIYAYMLWVVVLSVKLMLEKESRLSA